MVFGLGLLLLLLPVALHIWHLRRLRKMRESMEALGRRVAALETTLRGAAPSVPPPTPAPVVASSAVPISTAQPPPLPIAPMRAPAVSSSPRLNWENAIGVKFFAWMGGLALFVGVLLAVRYAFENNLITPGMRVVGGALVGFALVAGGLFAAARRFHAPAFSLCATGVLVLYGDIYAAHAYYNLLPLWLATVLMTAVSAGAFWLALRLEAQVIVVLGMIGGFLTPALLWTSANRPLPLFGYAALLNLGVAAVAIRKRWDALVPLAAIGTVATEFVWLAEFFGPSTASIARIVFVFFGLQFLLICLMRQRLDPPENWGPLAAAFALHAGILAAFSFAYTRDARIHSAEFIFPYVFVCLAGVIALAVARQFARGGMPREWMVAAGLALTWTLQCAWHDEQFSRTAAFAPLLSYLAIFALFVAYPYFAGPTAIMPWTISAIAGVLQFASVYHLCSEAYVMRAMGLLPLAFALPFAAGVWFLVRMRGIPLNSPDGGLASQAGAALVFLSLLIPVQFRGEWITVGWALEGVALLLLYRLMPNARLQQTAVIVLCAAFVRLAFNPAVFEYHPRTGTPIWNWYLYGYGIPALCLLFAGRLLQQMKGEAWIARASSLLYTLGGITLFLLLNIQIADYFSIGPTLTFSFSGNFARDMTYSIAWALFAFALLLIGMRQKSKWVRYAALALLLITLVKLFLLDFANLGQLYRIGAFIGVAIILIVASFVYQRFLAPAAKERSPDPADS